MIKRINGRIIYVLIIALLLCSCVAIMTNQSIVYADSLNETRDVDEVCRTYTDSISPNGIDFNVYLSAFENEKYPRYTCDVATTVGKVVLPQNDLYGNNVQYSGSHSRADGEVDGDDNIVKLIPRELFTYANKTLFVGKKYGFLIVTNCSSTGFCTSTVIMIEVVGDVSDYLADITLNVRNTLEFAYITANQTSTTLPYMNSLSSSGIIVSYTLNNGLTSAVVPMPGIQNFTNATTTEKRLGYFESNRYTLANISFGAKISSHNKYNQWDSQYDASADTGYFFTGNNYYYSATKYQNAQYCSGFTEIAQDAISAGIDKVVALVGETATEAILPLDIAVTALKVCNAFIPLSQNIEYKETNGKYGYGYNAQYLPNTKQGQLSAYGNLVKASHMVLNGTDETVVYFKKGDYANAQFSYSHTDGAYDYTQFEFCVGANVYDNSRNVVGAVVSGSAYYDINTSSVKTMYSYIASDYYLLPYGAQSFSYTPDYCGDYVIEGLDSSIELYLNNVKQSRQSDGTYSLKLVGVNAYTISLKNKSYISCDGQLLLMPKSVSQGNNTLQLDANTTSVVSFKPTASGVYTITMPNAIVKDVLIKNNNGTAFEHNNTLSTSDNMRDELSVYLKRDDTFIIILKNSASTTLNGTLSVRPQSNSWTVGTNATCFVYPEVTYYSFTVPSDSESTVDYVFTFTNAQNVHFMVLNENGEFCNVLEKSNGWLLVRNLIPGKKYYVGIYGNQDIDVIPVCAKNKGDVYTWKVYDGNKLCSADSAGIYTLQRGKSYTVSLWVNGNYQYTDILKTFDSISNYTATSAIYNINTGTLTLTEDRDVESYVTLTAEDVSLVSTSIKTDMNSNEIAVVIDYANKIQANFTKSDYIRWVNYTISGKNASGASFSYSKNTVSPTYTTGITDLYDRKAVGMVTIKVNSVTLINKYNGGTFTRSISNVSDSIDCSATNIYNALQFYNIRYHDSDRFKMKEDIDLSTLGERWTPIPEFNGSFLGNLHGLSGLNIYIPSTVTSTANYGLFAKITEQGSVGGITLMGGTITSDSIHDRNWINVGMLAGENYGSVTLNTVNGTIECNRNCASIGGIIGSNHGTVGLNLFEGTVFGNGDIGGIIGTNHAGEVSYNGVGDAFIKHYVVDEARSVGGIIGYCCGGEILNSTIKNTAITIENTSNVKNIKTRMGIIIGHLDNATMKNNNTIENCTTSTGKLKKTDYCFKEYNGQIGRITNGTVE